MERNSQSASGRPHPGFQTVLSRNLILLTIVPVLTIAVAGAWYFGDLLEKAAIEELRGSAERVRDQLDAHLSLHTHAVSTAAFGARAAVRAKDEVGLSRWLEQLHRSYPGFLTMLIAGKDGRIITASRRGTGTVPRTAAGRAGATVADREYFRRVLATGQPYISGIFRGRGLGSDLIVAVSAPVTDPSGTVEAVIEGSIDITRIPVTIAKSTFSPLVVAHDGAGEVVYASGPLPVDWPNLRTGVRKVPAAEVRVVRQLRDPRFAINIPLRDVDWQVTAAIPLDSVRQRSRTFYLYACLFFAVGAIVVGRVASIIARRVARPIVDIAAQMSRYEVGEEFAAATYRSAPAEIIHIQTELNRLGVRLRESYEGLRRVLAERDEANHKLETLLRSLDLKVAERTAELAESQARYALAARGSNDGIWDWDLRTGKVHYSERWKSSLGLPPRAELCTLECWLSLAHPQDAERLERELNANAASGADLFEIEYRLRHTDGTWRWMRCRGAAERDESGRAFRMAGSQSDITSGKLADPLTGLENRLGVMERLLGLINRAHEDPCYSYAVLYLDLDRFKLVNESMGHVAGDQLLIEVAQRLGAALQNVPGAAGTVGRIGGDEFAILLESPGEVVAEDVAHAIQESMRAPFHLGGGVVFASASIGLAQARPDYHVAEHVLRDADTAMYCAKSRGPGEIAAFDDPMRTNAIQRLELESALRQAIDRDEFELFYQPQVSLRTGQLFGMEALVRWRHPSRGLVSPGEFIPVAEETGLIQPLGRWILKEACRQVAEWLAMPGCEGLKVSVNLSGRQLAEHDLPSQVQSILAETGLPGASLHLEVTESVLADDPVVARTILTSLADMGIGLEVDDFGTGYSSLGQLHEMPFRTLKIDRSFVQSINSRPDGIKLVNSILMLARSLGLNAVAEGLETADDVLQLASMGCEFAQGYFFSPPLEAVRMQALIEAKRAANGLGPSNREPLLLTAGTTVESDDTLTEEGQLSEVGPAEEAGWAPEPDAVKSS